MFVGFITDVNLCLLQGQHMLICGLVFTNFKPKFTTFENFKIF